MRPVSKVTHAMKWLSTGLLFSAAAVSAKQVEVHDPVMTKEGDTYYVFSTGPGITYYESKDLTNWKLTGRVFKDEPSWAKRISPSFDGHLWAPDVYEKNGKFYLYYSVSAFGKNTSAIGVTVNETLDPSSPDYKWIDYGIVVESVPERDDWNAIDPAIIEDDNGTPWMSFGSFWGGLKLVQLDDDMVRLAKPEKWHHIASRPNTEHGPIEAPYIFKKNGYYYLFVSFDKCCRGVESTYNVRVGRSKNIEGPYLDQQGRSMVDGGGSLVIEGGTSTNLSIQDNFSGISTVINNRTYYLGQSFTNGLANPEVKKHSGNIIYVDNRPSITRSSNQKEDIKVILQF